MKNIWTAFILSLLQWGSISGQLPPPLPPASYPHGSKILEYTNMSDGTRYRSLLDLAKYKVSKGDLLGAYEDYNLAVGLDSLDFRAWQEKGKVRIKLNVEGAMYELNRATSLYSECSSAYFLKGRIKEGSGDLKGALIEYRNAIDYHPHISRSLKEREITTPIDEERIHRDCTQIRPETYFIGRGKLKAKMSDHRGAIEDFSIALKRHSGGSDAHFQRGLSLLAVDEVSEACFDLLKAYELGIPEALTDFRDNCSEWKKLASHVHYDRDFMSD